MAPKSAKKRRQEVPAADATEEGSPDLGTPVQRAEEADGESRLLSLHRARFIDWEPTAVTASAASGDGSILAVARDSGAIELWETEHWSCLTTLLGSKELAVTSLAWLQNEVTKTWHLFSGGLDGSLTEWDVSGRKPKHRTDALGGAVWALAVQPPSADDDSAVRVAAACDDGCLRFFRIEDGEAGLVYECSLPRVSGRLLCAAWHPNGRNIVTGTSDGSLHIWNVAAKRELSRLHTGDERKQRQDVWAAAVLRDGTMVTGDSGGNVQFWDATHGSLISGYRIHIAAVLALAPAPDGTHVFASGVDSQIAIFQKIETDGVRPTRWEYLTSKRPHTHDVRTMTVIQQQDKLPLMVSGGNDAQLFAYWMTRFTEEHPFRLTRVPESPRIQLATERKGPPLLLSAERENCDIWQLGLTASFQQKSKLRKEGQHLVVEELPCHIARLTTAGSGNILACAISAEGAFVAVADNTAVHLYRLETDVESCQAKLAKAKPVRIETSQPATALAFGEQQLLVADAEAVTMFELASHKKAAQIVLPTSTAVDGRLSSCVALLSTRSLAVAPGGKFAALLRPAELHLLNLGEMTHHSRIPGQEGRGPYTVAAFTPSGTCIAVATADNSLALHNVVSTKLADLEDDFLVALGTRLTALPGSIAGISFLPNPKRTAAFITTPGGISFVDFQAPMQPRLNANKRRKAAKRGLPQGKPDGVGTNGRVIKLASICLNYSFSAPEAAVMVEKDWSRVAEAFLPPVYRHRYGT